jgi:hypothetical protein
MMENRSFRQFIGWLLPGAGGSQAALTFVESRGATRSTGHMTRSIRCGLTDPDHSYEGGRIQPDISRVDRATPGRAGVGTRSATTRSLTRRSCIGLAKTPSSPGGHVGVV